ncbi:MAG: pyruvate dehydrogenase (acetyl-transferring) E1 component subunit alpha, partial [Simkaniaceae bacterium]|nr:pyruvate dehydrogenase (acetyl-transferring) E1 component subunit alpha [Simkaniaceae bacterium]
MDRNRKIEHDFFSSDAKVLLKSLGKEKLVETLRKMLLIRNFEIRSESAYQHGKIGGFFHAYMGQEAIQTAAVDVMGIKNWWVTTYRCHALALLMGCTPNELMAELYGKSTGNVFGRGGSMHFYSERMLGGFGIVGGHVPIATGAAFTAKYLKTEEVAVCFMGDGAIAQGAFHESLNIAALWDLPCIYVVENNHWGMGTGINRAIAFQPIAEKVSENFNIEGYTFDGMDYFNCYAGFKEVYEKVKKDKKPVIIEAVTERFRGHSISDPALYRSKEALEKCKV